MKFHPVEGELFQSDGQKDDTTKVIVPSRNFVHVSENKWSYTSTPSIRLHAVDRNTLPSLIRSFSLVAFQYYVLLCCYFWMTLLLVSSSPYYGLLI